MDSYEETTLDRNIPTAHLVFRCGWANSPRAPYFTAMAGAWYTQDDRSDALLRDAMFNGEGTAVWY